MMESPTTKRKIVEEIKNWFKYAHMRMVALQGHNQENVALNDNAPNNILPVAHDPNDNHIPIQNLPNENAPN